MANDVKVLFKADTSNLQAGIERVSGGLKGLGRTLAAVMAPLAALAGAGAALATAFKGITLAADMESTQTSFATLLGSMDEAKKLLADINKEAETTPYGFTDLAASARSLLAVTDQENITKTLRMIGDLASASQKPITELASMYAKIKGGDIVQGEDLNMISDALGGKALQEFAYVLGVDSIKAVRELGSEGRISGAMLEQVFKNLTSEGGMAFNAMAAQSTTFNGLISTLKDNWEGLLRTFGEPIMFALKPFLEDGISLLDNMKVKARAVGEAVAMMITTLKSGGWKDVLFNGFMYAVTAMGEKLLSIVTLAGQVFTKAIQDSMEGTELGKALTSMGLMNSKKTYEYDKSFDRWKKGGFMFEKKEIDNPKYKAPKVQSFGDIDKGIQGTLGSSMWADKLQETFNKFKKAPAPPPSAPSPSKVYERPGGTIIDTLAGIVAFSKTLKDEVAKEPKEKKIKSEKPFTPVLSSLAKIGGSAAALGKDPLVALQRTANDYLRTIAGNTSKKQASVWQ